MDRARIAAVGLLAAVVAAAGVAPGATAEDAAQDASQTQWDISEPRGEARRLKFTTTEGTWMSVSVSPKDDTIVFDLLGDLYTLPREGGRAQPLLSGRAWEIEPRFSPDGEHIAFISDRDGTQNIWLIRPDGTGLRQVSHETFEGVSSPTWAPDGKSIIARQKRSRQSPTYKGPWIVVRYQIDDGTKDVVIDEALNASYQSAIYPFTQVAGLTASGPSFSPDGEKLYLAGQVGPIQIGNRSHPATQILSMALDSDEKPEQITEGYNGAFRPEASPDGTKLAFGRREGASTSLWVRDLDTGEERRVLDNITRDALGSRMINDLLPSYAWSADSSEIIIAKDGHIKTVDVASGKARRIPFAAEVDLVLSEQVKPVRSIDDGPVRAKALRWFTPSPDGSRLAFQALGRIWVVPAEGGNPELLTAAPLAPTAYEPDALFEYAPAWSPDGQSLAYTTWHKTDGGQVWIKPLDEDAPRRVTSAPAVYSNPAFSPDGTRLVYAAVSPPHSIPGKLKRKTPVELREIDLDNGEERTIFTGAGSIPAPTFSGDGSRIHFLTELPKTNTGASITTRQLVSIDANGDDQLVHLRKDWLEDAAVSPSGERVALVLHGSVYLLEMPAVADDETAQVDLSTARRLTRRGANGVSWIDDETVAWGFATDYFTLNVDRPDAEPIRAEIDLSAPRDIPEGTFAVTGARLITVPGAYDGVIERGDIVVRDNRILAVGPTGEVPIPDGAHRIDGSGTTIIPGLVDIHAHPFHGSTGEITPQQQRGVIANLAYGITTAQDPASESTPSFAMAELIETGQSLGSRYFGTGSKVAGFQAQENELIESYEAALMAVEQRRALGATVIKEYGQPSRRQRQWVTEAARETGLGLVHEGTGDLHAMLTSALDGATAHEHSMSYAPVYNDVITLLAFSKTNYDPLLIHPRTGSGAAFYLGDRLEAMADDKVHRYTEPGMIAARMRMFRMMNIPDYDYADGFINQGADAARIARAGGHVTTGSHGDGLILHLETWSFVIAGMTPMEALYTATLSGAKAIGVDGDIGTLEPGKVADFVVLDANPLDHIENTMKIRYVVKNGRVYDDQNLDEVWPAQRQRSDSAWLNQQISDSTTQDEEVRACGGCTSCF